MQPSKCEKHKLDKNFLFCLEQDCHDRLACKKCNVLDNQHCNHRFVMVDYFMDNDQDELERIFGQNYI